MDEVQVAPLRPALSIGADAGDDGDAGLWLNADFTSEIGPLQEDKIFYSTTSSGTTALPSTYTDSTCANLPANVVCVIAYTVPTTNVQSYISNIPSWRAVVFVFGQEPERNFSSASAFITEFEDQATLIRHSANDAPNIFVAEDSSTTKYVTGTPVADHCTYIVNPGYTDFYLADHYQPTPNGNPMPTGQNGSNWTNWLNCVSNSSGFAKKPIGLAEYGLGTCGVNGETTRNASLTADGPYLKTLPDTIRAPIVDWGYWWIDDPSRTNDPCRNWKFPVGSVTARTWQGTSKRKTGAEPSYSYS